MDKEKRKKDKTSIKMKLDKSRVVFYIWYEEMIKREEACRLIRVTEMIDCFFYCNAMLVAGQSIT